MRMVAYSPAASLRSPLIELRILTSGSDALMCTPPPLLQVFEVPIGQGCCAVPCRAQGQTGQTPSMHGWDVICLVLTMEGRHVSPYMKASAVHCSHSCGQAQLAGRCTHIQAVRHGRHAAGNLQQPLCPGRHPQVAVPAHVTAAQVKNGSELLLLCVVELQPALLEVAGLLQLLLCGA